ncbi:glutaminase A [uncultured Corynebacterium sp.]|uniref:glutaminase A n=1 Tax=uncultured Corynebacterium sp. TaxID=159447 RepID=UPI002624F567|nr:glutaminase A [uncultured Corynebacterium sp.]
MTGTNITSPFRETFGAFTEACRGITKGENADYIPALANVDPNLWATAVMSPDGDLYAFGDIDHKFTIQSISKPLVYGIAIEELGIEKVTERVGVEPSGDAFNEISLDKDGRPVNPMINAGALAVHGLLQEHVGSSAEKLILEVMSKLANRELDADMQIGEEEREAGFRNRAIANLLRSTDVITCDPLEVFNGYSWQCSININVCDLATIGATLANGGVNPLSGERVFSDETSQWVLSVMSTSGMYNAAGNWMNKVGIPAKSGVAGGILGVIPGQLSLASFSPPLDEFGNSERGNAFFDKASNELGLHMMRVTGRPQGAVRQRAQVDFDEDGVQDTTLLRLYGDIDFCSYEPIDREVTQGATSGTQMFVDLVEVRSLAPRVKKMLEQLLESAAGETTVFVHDPADLLDHDVCAAPQWVDQAEVRSYESPRPARRKPRQLLRRRNGRRRHHN